MPNETNVISLKKYLVFVSSISNGYLAIIVEWVTKLSMAKILSKCGFETKNINYSSQTQMIKIKSLKFDFTATHKCYSKY